MKSFIRKYLLICLVLIFTAITSCETSFEPLQEHDFAFSMYGTIDLHGGISVVRVMPIGKRLIPADTASYGTEVTLVHPETDVKIILSDTLRRFGGDAYVWNYSTIETLLPHENYTLFATSPAGSYSKAEITLPAVLPVPEVEYSELSEEGTVTGFTQDSIAAVETRYLVQGLNEFGCDPEIEVILSHIDDVITYPNGEYFLELSNRSAIRSALGRGITGFVVNRREVIVVSAGQDWPVYSGLSEEEKNLPDLITNVENGTGYVAGIASRKVVITPRRDPC